jgi:cytoskeletal protein RodZ
MTATRNDSEQTDGLSVGKILRQRRVALGKSLTDVEIATRIRGKFLILLESGDFNKLANDIYTHGFIRTYAVYLGLDAKKLMQQYLKERGTPAPTNHRGPAHRQLITRKLVFTPKLIAIGATLLTALLIAAYLSWQFALLAAAPQLQVTSPTDDQVIFGSLVDVSGTVGSGAEVFINNSPVLTDGNGTFHDKLALQEGVNVINITAKNRLSKTTTVTRNILAHLPKVEEEKLPDVTFDGVAALIEIKDSATRLVVEVDGKAVFSGTMLAGTSQLFKGTQQVKVTTFNAGSTLIKLTNDKIENRDLGVQGGPGEVKRDLLFEKGHSYPL